jgi:hypothetical protein
MTDVAKEDSKLVGKLGFVWSPDTTIVLFGEKVQGYKPQWTRMPYSKTVRKRLIAVTDEALKGFNNQYGELPRDGVESTVVRNCRPGRHVYTATATGNGQEFQLSRAF